MKKCHKVGYASKFQAEARALWLHMIKPWKYPALARVYACSACMKWHLTSTPGYKD